MKSEPRLPPVLPRSRRESPPVGLGRRARQALLGLLLLAVGGAAATAAAVSYGEAFGEVSRVRVGAGVDETRLVIELDQPVSARLVSDSAATNHIVIALPKVHAADDLQGGASGRLRQWRLEPAAGAVRLAVDFDGATVIKRRFLLPPDDGVKVYRYVIDFAPAAASEVAAQRGPALLRTTVSAPPAPAANLRPSLGAKGVLTAAQIPMSARKVVVIDAGHGGKDPGTSGAQTVEKDLTLAAARDLRTALQRTGRYQVVMTRDNDVFIPLDQRMQIARREHADLFISLHVNSINDPSLHGASVYTLSEKGEDRVARRVIAKGGANGDWLSNGDAPTHDASVNRILLDLTQRETTNQSTSFANMLLDRLNGRVDLVRRSHRDANFAVLLAADVPAVLMEMGFITNSTDEQRLASAEQRRVLADSITDAIDSYFARPTRLAVR